MAGRGRKKLGGAENNRPKTFALVLDLEFWQKPRLTLSHPHSVRVWVSWVPSVVCLCVFAAHPIPYLDHLVVPCLPPEHASQARESGYASCRSACPFVRPVVCSAVLCAARMCSTGLHVYRASWYHIVAPLYGPSDRACSVSSRCASRTSVGCSVPCPRSVVSRASTRAPCSARAPGPKFVWCYGGRVDVRKFAVSFVNRSFVRLCHNAAGRNGGPNGRRKAPAGCGRVDQQLPRGPLESL